MLKDVLPEQIVSRLPQDVCEVRMRVDKPLCYFDGSKLHVASFTVTQNEMQFTLDAVTGHSLYALTEKMNFGYITMEGGVRVGIAGEAVMHGDKVHIIKNVTSLVIRVPHQIFGASKCVDVTRNFNQNVIIISPPACGKTTFLRDLARRISNQGKNVVIIDERSEITGASGGKFYLDVGSCSDAVVGLPKKLAYVNVLRSMNPDYIVTDELGGKEDVDGLLSAYHGGVKVVATLHGNSAENAFCGEFAPLEKVFDRAVLLDKVPTVGTVKADILLSRNEVSLC